MKTAITGLGRTLASEYGAGKCIADCDANPRKPGAIEQLRHLEKALGAEAELIEQLSGRLAPILRPVDADKSGCNTIMQEPSQLSEELRMLQCSATMNIASLSDLLQRIDL